MGASEVSCVSSPLPLGRGSLSELTRTLPRRWIHVFDNVTAIIFVTAAFEV